MTHDIPSAEAWFASGESVGYDPQARAIVPAQGAPLNVFLRHEGDLTHAVSFLPGFPDGSFGWASWATPTLTSDNRKGRRMQQFNMRYASLNNLTREPVSIVANTFTLSPSRTQCRLPAEPSLRGNRPPVRPRAS